jgi:hypothetical protein
LRCIFLPGDRDKIQTNTCKTYKSFPGGRVLALLQQHATAKVAHPIAFGVERDPVAFMVGKESEVLFILLQVEKLGSLCLGCINALGFGTRKKSLYSISEAVTRTLIEPLKLQWSRIQSHNLA